MKLVAMAFAVIGLLSAQDPPAAPTGVAATTPANGQIRLDWNANNPTPSGGYNVWRAPVSSGAYTKVNIDPISGTTFTNSGLTSGTPYFYVVRAVNGAGESANSSEVSAIPTGTDNTAPAPPVITSQTRKTRDTSPSTSGTAEPGSRVDVFSGSTNIGWTTTAANGTWTVSNPSGLGSDGVYSITVRATDGSSNQSGPSNAIQITLDTTPPTIPTNLRVMATPTFIDLEWNASSSADVAGYKVYRSVNSGSWVLLNTTGLVTITKYRDSSVSSGNTYRYRVTAMDDALDN